MYFYSYSKIITKFKKAQHKIFYVHIGNLTKQTAKKKLIKYLFRNSATNFFLKTKKL